MGEAPSRMDMRKDLEKAWNGREKSGVFKSLEAVRIFHGPGEGSGPLSRVALDRFGEHYWLTEWESKEKAPAITSEAIATVVEFLKSKKAASVVALFRPEKGKLPEEPKILAGD